MRRDTKFPHLLYLHVKQTIVPELTCNGDLNIKLMGGHVYRAHMIFNFN